MNCKDFLARHSDWYDGLLEHSAAVRFQLHADACDSCARYDRVVRRGVELVRELPGVELSSDFESRMRHRLYHERDAMAAARRSGLGVYAVAASILFVTAAAGWFGIAASRTPIVDGQAIYAVAPPAATSVEANARAVASDEPMLALAAKSSAPAEELAPIEAEVKGHDPHVASANEWPVYSRPAVRVAFPASHTTLVVRPADFRDVGSRVPVVPLLIRH